MRLVLASQSPRRKMLMEQLGLQFECKPAVIDETILFETDPVEVCTKIAIMKATQIAEQEPLAIVVAADTIVVLDRRILGKPRDKAEAAQMLSALSGREHQVITALCLFNTANKSIDSQAVISRVRFRNIEKKEILAYINSGEPWDKAGSYGIQGLGAVFVEHLEGCFYNVVGLPLYTLYLMLQKQGVHLLGGVENGLPAG